MSPARAWPTQSVGLCPARAANWRRRPGSRVRSQRRNVAAPEGGRGGKKVNGTNYRVNPKRRDGEAPD